MMCSDRDLIKVIIQVASAWRDPEHPVRKEAVQKTLEAPNTFTEEAIAFAVNQQTHQLEEGAIDRWINGRRSKIRRTVGVLNAGNIPLVGLQDFLAVLLTGHTYFGTVSSKSPYLLSAFARELREYYQQLPASFGTIDEMYQALDAVIATGSEEALDWINDRNDLHGIDTGRSLLRGHRYAVAVLDGRETDEDRDGLAEDVLLHEGYGCRNVAVIWAPAGYSPDDVLQSFAAFRGVFPVHAGTPGRLKMQQAFLDAMDRPHAYGDGLEFLMSKGDPEVQQPGHVRWTEYEEVNDVIRWIEDNREKLQLVVARPGFASSFSNAVSVESMGQAQRPALDWQPDGIDTIEFLSGL